MSRATHVLRIEHGVADFDSWKRNAFDADPIGRERMRVRGYRVGRAVEDPNLVTIDLEFDSHDAAEAMHRALRELWGNPLVRINTPTARVVELVEVDSAIP